MQKSKINKTHKSIKINKVIIKNYFLLIEWYPIQKNKFNTFRTIQINKKEKSSVFELINSSRGKNKNCQKLSWKNMQKYKN